MDSSSSSEEEIHKNNRSNDLKANQKSYRMREKLKVDEHSLYQSSDGRKFKRKNEKTQMNKFSNINQELSNHEISHDELSNDNADLLENGNIFNMNAGYSDMDDTDTETDNETENETDNEFPPDDSIYDNSNIKIIDFALSFLLLCKKIKINSTAKDTILEYIATLLPLNNKIPTSYKKLTKNFKLNSVKKTQLCNSCFKEFCNCLRLNDKKIFVYEFDLVNQLTSIIRKNWEISCRYRGIFVLIIISNYKYT